MTILTINVKGKHRHTQHIYEGIKKEKTYLNNHIIKRRISHTKTLALSTHSSSVNVVLVRRVSANAHAPSGPILFPVRLVWEGVRV